MKAMSTSRKRETPIDYMSSDSPNLLWALQASSETDAGYHCGADISMLSQFASEEAVLFPPTTMLVVQHRKDDRGPEADPSSPEVKTASPRPPPLVRSAPRLLEVTQDEAVASDGTSRRFLLCTCRPSFV